jgi:hypothetical protein
MTTHIYTSAFYEFCPHTLHPQTLYATQQISGFTHAACMLTIAALLHLKVQPSLTRVKPLYEPFVGS